MNFTNAEFQGEKEGNYWRTRKRSRISGYGPITVLVQRELDKTTLQ